jgi:hypothetical protein
MSSLVVTDLGFGRGLRLDFVPRQAANCPVRTYIARQFNGLIGWRETDRSRSRSAKLASVVKRSPATTEPELAPPLPQLREAVRHTAGNQELRNCTEKYRTEHGGPLVGAEVRTHDFQISDASARPVAAGQQLSQ